MKNFCVQFCKALKRLRECAGKGQIAFAKDLGLSQPVYARYEKGDREPTLNELIRIANVLNTTPNDLLGFAPLRASAPPRENTARRGTSAAQTTLQHERQKRMKPDYSDLFDLLKKIDELLPKEWPSELPPESTPGFWEIATRQEFAHRATLTQKIRLALSGDLQSAALWSPIEAWLFQRRLEWATQIAFGAALRRMSCHDTPREFLLNVIVDHWHEEGALAFWEHAIERDGLPPPASDEDIERM